MRPFPSFFTCLCTAFFLFTAPAFAQAVQPPAAPKDPPDLQTLVLTRTEGAVRILEPDSPFPKPPGDLPRILNPGEKVQTTRNAKALIFSQNDEILLDGDSLLTVLASDGAKLESGVALFEITARDGRRITAQTPLVVIGVKATLFLVSSNKKREDVALIKGAIGVERQDKQAMALFEAKDPREMTFSEYVEFQRKSFGDYKATLMQDFKDYKSIMAAEFKAFKEEIDLKPGRRLTLGTGEKPEAVEAAMDKATEEAVEALQRWKMRKALQPSGLLQN